MNKKAKTRDEKAQPAGIMFSSSQSEQTVFDLFPFTVYAGTQAVARKNVVMSGSRLLVCQEEAEDNHISIGLDVGQEVRCNSVSWHENDWLTEIVSGIGIH